MQELASTLGPEIRGRLSETSKCDGLSLKVHVSRNVSETLPGPRQTNQRAELTAIFRALEIVPKNLNVSIITDSKYGIDCVTVWCINWRKNGWKTSAGKAVENKDLVESILAKIEERESLGTQTTFEWIKGHNHHPGNIEADRLAVEGARKADRR